MADPEVSTSTAPAVRASIIVIGDEILEGYVRDTNAAWLSGRLRTLGIGLDRMSVVTDEVDAIIEALHAEFARSRPRVVFTSGGIGTTPDDRTMAAVAEYLDVGLVDEPALRTMVDGIITRAAQRGQAIDERQRAALGKMARVPRGAVALQQTDASAPAVRIDVDGGLDTPDGAAVIVLPGVPTQFRELVGILEATLLDGRGRADTVVELRHPYPESVLSPTLEDLETRLPSVRIGSYPGPQCLLRVKGTPEDVDTAVTALRQVIDEAGVDPGMRQLADAWRRGWEQAERAEQAEHAPRAEQTNRGGQG